jgi:nicotinate-nucleotide pyrophosphorylase (carboxylating)
MTLDQIVKQAIAEDIGDGDHTSLATIPADATGSARLLVKQDGILCGVEVALEVFRQTDEDLKITLFYHDGAAIRRGDIVFTVTGKVHSILRSERLVLNFMQRMSGIATATARLVKLTEGFPVRLLDTRKTTPLLRGLEKHAVKTGGGGNHRMGLYDMIMIKDNHVDFAGGIVPAIDAARDYLSKTSRRLKIELEVRSMEELKTALERGGIDRIMLDNFPVPLLKEAVTLIGGRFETEASGGITETNLRDYAATGVDYISVGALTHQIRSLDLSLKAC